MKKLAFVLSVILTVSIVLPACGSRSAGSAAESTGAALSVSQGNTDAQTVPGSTAESIPGGGGASEWAQHPIASLAPEPGNTVLEVQTNTDVDFIAAMDWSRDAAAAYAETVKAAGFDQKITLLDEIAHDVESYIYQAKNKDGVYISIEFYCYKGGEEEWGGIVMSTDSEY